MAMRQPIKSAASALRGKAAAKAHVGDGLEAILQNNPQLRRLVLQAKDRGSVTFDQLNAALPQDFPPEQTEEVIQLLDAQGHHGPARRPGRRDRGRCRRGRARGRGRAGRGRRCGGRGGSPGPRGGARPHRRSGAHVPARDGHDRAALPRGRDRDRQAHRGRPQHRARGPVREPAHHARGDRLARRDPRGPRAAARHHRSRGHQRCRPSGRGGGRRQRRQRRYRGRRGVGRDLRCGRDRGRRDRRGGSRCGACCPRARRGRCGWRGDDEADGEAPLPAEDEEAEAGPAVPELLEEDDFDEDTLSLSALENKLRDGVLETFDGIAEAYRGLRDLQEERLAPDPGAARGAGPS